MEVGMFTFFCLMLLASSSTVVGSPKSIFILAGQSNMVGQGGVVNNTWDKVVPPQCQANPLILQLAANLTWEEAQEPLHQGPDANVPTAGIGPGMPFSNSILERDPSIGVIGLVPCASGGSDITQWSRGNHLYNQLVARAQAAVLNGGGIIRAILWYQGESDTRTYEQATAYKCRLQRFFTDVRSDLLSPLLPVIQVALASGLDKNNIEIVRRAQLETELPNVKCVDAKGLQLEPDNMHLTAAAQVQLGTMLADAFLQMC